MKKEILEEIDRIREVMGLITEGTRWPWFGPLVTSIYPTVDRSLLAAASRGLGRNKLGTFADDVIGGIEDTIKNGGNSGATALTFKNAVTEWAFSKGMTYKDALMTLMKSDNDTVAKEFIAELAASKALIIAQKGIGALKKELDDVIDSFMPTHQRQADDLLSYIDGLASKSNKNALDEINRILDNVKNTSPEFKKFYENLFSEKKKQIETKMVDDTPVRFDDAELRRFNDSEASVTVPEGAIKTYLTTRFKRFTKLTPQQQSDLVDTMAAKIADAFDKTYSKLTSDGDSFESIQKIFNDRRISPAKRKEIMIKAIKESNTSLGVFQNTMDWIVKYLTGFDIETQSWFWQNGDWAKVMKNWFFINAGFGVFEFFIRGYVTREDNPEDFGKDDIERFMNRFDFVALMLRMLPIPGIARLAISEIGQAMIEAGGARMPTAEEIIEKFGAGYNRRDVQSFPKYSDNQSIIDSFKGKCTWVVGPKGQDMGIWTYDLKKGLFELVPSSGSSTPIKTDTEYELGLESFKKFLTDNGLSAEDAKNDTGEGGSGFWKGAGNDYEYDETKKTYIQQ
jgi:hypothetical protein